MYKVITLIINEHQLKQLGYKTFQYYGLNGKYLKIKFNLDL